MARLKRWGTRLLFGTAGYLLKRRAATMAATMPTLTGAELARVAADGGPDDMVLLNEDGTLLLDSTPDDIATYQVAGNWPRYVCRLRSVTSLLNRSGPDTAAERLNTQMAAQFALESLTGPHATGAPVPPNNAPQRISESGVTIRNA